MKADNTEPNQHLIAKRWFNELKHGEQLRLLSKYKKDVYNDYDNYYVSYADALHIYQSETSQAETPESDKATIQQLADAIDNKELKVTFGLQQSHIDIINQVLHKWNVPQDYGTVDMTYTKAVWEEAGKKCGWEPFTLALYYFENRAKWQSEQSPSTSGIVGWVKVSERMPPKQGLYCVKRLGENITVIVRKDRNGNPYFSAIGGMPFKGWKEFEWLDESPATCKESQGDVIDWENIKLSVNHIFESGANEIRVFELIKLYLNRYTPKQ